MAETIDLTIGVLAIQGDYHAHAHALKAAAAANPAITLKTVEVRKPSQLAGLDALAMPGGESTTMLKFLERDDFFETLKEFLRTVPVFATCAGAILLAEHVTHPAQKSLGLLNATVERNAYGRQIDSTILHEPWALGGGPLEMVFIRAPRITNVGSNVEVLASRDGFPTLVRQGNLLAATFHPEISHDLRVQELFIEMVVQAKAAATVMTKS